MTSERISDELLEQILTNDMATGSSADVGALIWLLAAEVAEHRESESKLAEVRAYAEAQASNDMSEWDFMAKLVGDGSIHCARGILAILDGDGDE